jgi:hypothetical protein
MSDTDMIVLTPEARREMLLFSIIGRIDLAIRPDEHAAFIFMAALQAGIDPGDLSRAVDALLAEWPERDDI